MSLPGAALLVASGILLGRAWLVSGSSPASITCSRSLKRSSCKPNMGIDWSITTLSMQTSQGNRILDLLWVRIGWPWCDCFVRSWGDDHEREFTSGVDLRRWWWLRTRIFRWQSREGAMCWSPTTTLLVNTRRQAGICCHCLLRFSVFVCERWSFQERSN